MKLFLSFFIAALVVVGCKDDNGPQPCYDPANPSCENYDPCFGKDTVRATFAIEQYLSSSNSLPDSLHYVEEERLFWPGVLRFTAHEEEAEYTWYLGSERIEEKQFERDFSQVQPGTVVGLSLVLQKSFTDQTCFPNDDGRDSVYREFKIVGHCDLDIDNRFRGVFEGSPDDSVELEITFRDFENGGCNHFGSYINFTLEQDTFRFREWFHSNSIYYSYNSGLMNNPEGVFQVNSKKDSAYFKYRLRGLDRVFRGRILNP